MGVALICELLVVDFAISVKSRNGVNLSRESVAPCNKSSEKRNILCITLKTFKQRNLHHQNLK